MIFSRPRHLRWRRLPVAAGASRISAPTAPLIPALIPALLLALACSTSEEVPPTPQQVPGQGIAGEPAGGTIIVRYEETERFDGLAQALASSGVFEGISESVDSVLRLRRPIEAVFTECDEANAFYTEDHVIMCYEFFDLFTEVFLRLSEHPTQVLDKVLGVGAFFYLHEIGHALVDQLEIPITGREEDAVDTLATLVLLLGGSERALFSAIDNFAVLSLEATSPEELPFWDVHSFDAQRLYDIACLIYGSDPESWGHIVGPDHLPEERAVSCPREFAQKSLAWDELLAPHYRTR